MTDSLRDRVADYFRAHPGQWISMQTLAGLAGTGGWRSRVSDCRTQLGLTIENKVSRVTLPNGEKITKSDYRYVPVVLTQPELFVPADVVEAR